MSTFRNPATNRLMSSLSSENLRRMLSGCEQVELVWGNILYRAGEPIHHVYFPTDSIISLMMPIDGGATLEVALIGNEGMYGIPLMLGVEVSAVNVVVQGAGRAWRMDADSFRNELKSSPTLQHTLNRYVYVSMRQLAQTAACNRFHLLEARLARWILMTRDRIHSDEFYITHKFLAQMLGVRPCRCHKCSRCATTKESDSLQPGKNQNKTPRLG